MIMTEDSTYERGEIVTFHGIEYDRRVIIEDVWPHGLYVVRPRGESIAFVAFEHELLPEQW